jgi:hypothetical protein
MYSSAWAICPQWQQATMVLNMTVTGLYIAHCKCGNALRRRSQSVGVSWDTSSAIATVYSLQQCTAAEQLHNAPGNAKSQAQLHYNLLCLVDEAGQ